MLSQEIMEICMEACIKAAYRTEIGRRPYVGALVLSKDEEPIGIGTKSAIPATEMYTHAERMALQMAGIKARGGTLITTLEPCVKVSKNQFLRPCCDLIKEAGIQRVIIGLRDPSLSVNGRGIKKLQGYGVEVHMYNGKKDPLFELLSREGKVGTDTYINPSRD